MQLLHVTRAQNLHSIMQSGLEPFPPRLDHHRECFLHDGLPERIIYAWKVDNHQRMAKITKDVAYWHVWGWRMNSMLDTCQKEDGEDHYQEMRRDPLYGHREGPDVEDETFLALAVDVPAKHCCCGKYVHLQKRVNGPCYDTDRRYSHRAPMTLILKTIQPKHVRPIGLAWTTSIKKKRRWTIDVHFRSLK